MTVIRLISSMAFAVVCASSASACSPIFEETWRDKPIEVGADCAFKHAGYHQNWEIAGQKAKSLGNGHITQKIAGVGGCVGHENLLVVNCEAAELILVEGRASRNAPDFGSGPDLLVKNILRAKGAIKLSKRTTVERVTKAAKRKGYTYETDLSDRLRELGARNRYDPFCGCKLHYPDSKGAKQ